MPIIVTFDISSPTPLELNRLRGAFERLGWEHLGNTAYRYPKLHGEHPAEDWFNHVIPALMLLRAYARYAESTQRSMTRFSIDIQSSTGFNPMTGVGAPPLAAADITYSQPSRAGRAFGRSNLEAWLDGIDWPYAALPQTQPETGT